MRLSGERHTIHWVDCVEPKSDEGLRDFLDRRSADGELHAHVDGDETKAVLVKAAVLRVLLGEENDARPGLHVFLSPQEGEMERFQPVEDVEQLREALGMCVLEQVQE